MPESNPIDAQRLLSEMSWLRALAKKLVVDAATALGGVRLLMAASTAVLALLSWVATERSPSLVTRVALMVPVLFIGLRTWSERPLLLGLMALASVLLVAEGRGRPAWLVALGAVWVNVHGSWPLGLALLAARAVGDAVGPHHLVVLVLEDVALPDVEPLDVEGGVHAGDLAGVRDDGVLPAGLGELGRAGALQGARRRIEGLAIDHLELHQVEVDRVGVG